MKSEIEAKFLNVNHDELRAKLTAVGAILEQPMRTMRRVVIHTPTMTDKNAFVRVRDEGNRITITYKQFDEDSIDGAKEYEVEVSDFETVVGLLTAAGLEHDTFQESRRENWRLGEVEVMLDEWPWLEPYVEIEGPTEESVRALADKLGFVWTNAIFGGVANAYQMQYPHIGEEGITEINQNWSVIKFSEPKPALIATR